MYYGDSLIKKFIPYNSCKQVSSKYFLDRILESEKNKIVLDLGCGSGDSIDYFRKKNKQVNWIGLDIGSSPEVDSRIRNDLNIATYNGINIPFQNECFDLIYAHQVFEHVHAIKSLICEVDRVLKNGGFLIGSTSQLEPFHSLSVCNFTPYGLDLILEGTSLKLKEIRPGIDVFSLLLNRIFARIPLISKFFSLYFERESPVNSIITMLGKMTGKTNQDINLLKLLFCGQFRFLIQKQK